MILTNKYNLPEPLVNATKRFTRSISLEPHIISVTQLIAPPQIRILEQAHKDEITEDAMDRLWAVLGSCVHVVLEKGAPLNTLTEERLAIAVNGDTLTGVPDLLEGTRLTDWKFVSAWSFLRGLKDEWIAQLNVYAEMYRQHGFAVEAAQIVAIFRDWSRAAALKNRDYPQQRALTIDVPLWSRDDAMGFIHYRLALHDGARHGNVPECTPNERWARPTLYAVRDSRRVRAKKICPTRVAAEAYIENKVPEKTKLFVSVETRPGESVRCMQGYCRVATWCPQFAAMPQPVKTEDAEVDDGQSPD